MGIGAFFNSNKAHAGYDHDSHQSNKVKLWTAAGHHVFHLRYVFGHQRCYRLRRNLPANAVRKVLGGG